jgi:hypothetical protein
VSNANELLRRVDDLELQVGRAIDEIRACLDSEPEAEEPVAWIQPNHLDKAQFMPHLCRVEPKQRDDFIPLYTRPSPARKPMAEEEIKMALLIRGFPYDAFMAGIRYAEKHHFGIGGDDE